MYIYLMGNVCGYETPPGMKQSINHMMHDTFGRYCFRYIYVLTIFNFCASTEVNRPAHTYCLFIFSLILF